MPSETRLPQLTVYVDDRPKRLFLGLKVKHAIGARKTRAVREHRAVVRDADGNQVDVDGALYDGERLFLASIDPTTFAEEVRRKAPWFNFLPVGLTNATTRCTIGAP